jgi:hypothetical protein
MSYTGNYAVRRLQAYKEQLQAANKLPATLSNPIGDPYATTTVSYIGVGFDAPATLQDYFISNTPKPKAAKPKAPKIPPPPLPALKPGQPRWLQAVEIVNSLPAEAKSNAWFFGVYRELRSYPWKKSMGNVNKKKSILESSWKAPKPGIKLKAKLSGLAAALGTPKEAASKRPAVGIWQ